MTWGQLAADIDRLAGPHTVEVQRLDRAIHGDPEHAARTLAGAILARREVAWAVPPALYAYWREQHDTLSRSPAGGFVSCECGAAQGYHGPCEGSGIRSRPSEAAR